MIIDDEPLARSLIRTLLSARPEFQILGECSNAVEAYELLLRHDVDVIFLDIDMPVISGIDFLRSLKHPPRIIFTTAYGAFAAEAFNLNAVDYMVKPITAERFEQALDKLNFMLSGTESSTEQAIQGYIDYFFAKVDGKLLKIVFDNILYMEAFKDFTKIYLLEGKVILVGEHLKAVAGMLPAVGFIRIHRSFLVSQKAITGIFGHTIELGNIQLPIGGNYRDQVFATLGIK